MFVGTLEAENAFEMGSGAIPTFSTKFEGAGGIEVHFLHKVASKRG